MKLTNYLLAIFAIGIFMSSCQNEGSSQSEGETGTIADDTYYFVEVKADADNDLFLKELILTVSGKDVTGKSISWFEEGDHETLNLEALTMSEVEVRGTIDGTNLELQEQEAEYGADHSADYVLKFEEPQTWSWEGNQLVHSMKDMTMKKVSKGEANSTKYRKLDNAKITH